ncbi:MAG TPA: dTDP-glucose 4,6-dehydratase [Firmicutes bacterium]|nr:dTDP-glucose 4,6-dehydratase [Bacillota bacterium]
MRLLVTGGAGFIGSNFIRYFLRRYPETELINVDLLTYAGNVANMKGFSVYPGYRFVHADINDRRKLEPFFASGLEAVVNFAAESHVDRSIDAPVIFARTNIDGTVNLLSLAQRYGVKRFIQISTDEVYGTLGAEGVFTETTPLAPNNPYAASKAGADLMGLAFYTTYGLPVIITRCSNNYGPYQFPEKLIPLVIINALREEPIPVYGDGQQVRDWIHVEDHCRALERVLLDGRPGQVYNIGARTERTNLEVVRRILQLVGKPERLIRFVGDRPGHDRRYAMAVDKIRGELGWEAQIDFRQGLAQTVAWYLEHRNWWRTILSGEYQDYYQRNYGYRLEGQ